MLPRKQTRVRPISDATDATHYVAWRHLRSVDRLRFLAMRQLTLAGDCHKRCLRFLRAVGPRRRMKYRVSTLPTICKEKNDATHFSTRLSARRRGARFGRRERVRPDRRQIRPVIKGGEVL